MATLEKLMLDKTFIKIKKFKMNEIQKIVKILHLNLEWEDIVDLVSECRLRLTVKNIVIVLKQFLKDSDSIEEIYHRVMLVDAIYHQSGQWWTVSLDKVKKRLLNKEIIRNNIQAMLDKLKIKAITYVMKCNQLFWISINLSETKTNNMGEPKLNNSYFFTVVPGKTSYIFHRPQNINNNLLKIVTKSVGANKCKPYALSGKHVQSLVGLLEDKNKRDNVQRLGDNYKEENVCEYAQKLFGTKCRMLEQFTLNIESDLSVFSNTNPEGKTCKTRVELKAESIMYGVKDMMLSGVLQRPYPDWVKRLPVLGKSCINIDIRP